jgi:hypothetical protein
MSLKLGEVVELFRTSVFDYWKERAAAFERHLDEQEQRVSTNSQLLEAGITRKPLIVE